MINEKWTPCKMNIGDTQWVKAFKLRYTNVEATGEDLTIPQFNSFKNTPPPKYSIFDLNMTHSTCFEYKWCSMVPAEHIKTVL
jgi:hypothetical protein